VPLAAMVGRSLMLSILDQGGERYPPRSHAIMGGNRYRTKRPEKEASAWRSYARLLPQRALISMSSKGNILRPNGDAHLLQENRDLLLLSGCLFRGHHRLD
jgi:hypothetical protein